MNNLQQVLQELKDKDPLGFEILHQLSLNARNEQLDPQIRIRCASVLGTIGADIIMESLRRELAPQESEPKYEYRFIRGARTKVRVS